MDSGRHQCDRIAAEMRDAGPDALKRLNTLLNDVRSIPGIEERRTGVFYLKSRPTLRFHEEGYGLYAQAKLGKDWFRFDITTPADRRLFLKTLRSKIPVQRG